MISAKNLKKEAISVLQKAGDEEDLQSFKNEYLGRKGKLNALIKSVKDLPVEKRAEAGREVNELKKEIEERFYEKLNARQSEREKEAIKKEVIDITLPGKKPPLGTLHPLTKIRREVEDIFVSLGFGIVEGPEVESEYYNFDALNIPAEHPARDMWDTFWLRQNKSKNKGKLLLRTHTSPVQIRFMESHQPPFRIIAPGKVFRYEATDASHDIEFYQVEGLVVDKDISVANLKHTILSLFRGLFGEEVEARLRPSYFPFVEPGFEVDMACTACAQAKSKNKKSKMRCSVCGNSGWIEMMGAGMVHPRVFKSAGLNPKLHQGYAFGIGLDRIAMMKCKIPDIRFFHQNDVRFLRQF